MEGWQIPINIFANKKRCLIFPREKIRKLKKLLIMGASPNTQYSKRGWGGSRISKNDTHPDYFSWFLKKKKGQKKNSTNTQQGGGGEGIFARLWPKCSLISHSGFHGLDPRSHKPEKNETARWEEKGAYTNSVKFINKYNFFWPCRTN